MIVVRDFRDVAVSIVHQIRKGLWPGLSAEQRDEFLALSFDEQLDLVIQYEYDVYEIAERSPHSVQTSLIHVANQAVRYAKDSRRLLVRYEDLVGEAGGGTSEAQLQTLQKIANFIEVATSNEKLQEIAL